MRDLGRWMVVGGVLAVSLSGCDDDLVGRFDPEVDNRADAFQIAAAQARDVSTLLEYTWRNTGAVADVVHTTRTVFGIARISVRAADGTRVYDRVLASDLEEQTAEGEPGDWTVEILLTDFTGTLEVRLQKP